jgi:hypothetical protein
VTARNTSLEALLRETHDRSTALFNGAFELVDAEDLATLLAEVSKDHDATARPCFVPDSIGEDQMEDFELQELLAAQIQEEANAGLSLSALEIEIRTDIQMSLEEYLGIQRNMTFEAG